MLKYITNIKSSVKNTYDIIIVGAGIVGLATARELLLQHNKAINIAIIDKEKDICQHQSNHNSNVIHSGMYYSTGSSRARLCVSGSKLLYEYCTRNNIQFKKTGKLIVATNTSELPTLHSIYQKGISNNVEGLEILSQEQISQIEPLISGVKAIYSPNTGIINYYKVCNSFRDDIVKLGGDILLNTKLVNISQNNNIINIDTRNSSKFPSIGRKYLCKSLIVCSGLHSDRIASLVPNANKLPKIVPFRGSYLKLKDKYSNLISHNIYPVPNIKFPFLGVHFTPTLSNEILLGPNAVLSLSREGYSRYFNFNLYDTYDSLSFSGLRQLAFKYYKFGVYETLADYFTMLTVLQLKKYMPTLKPSMVTRSSHIGVRAQAMNADGSFVDDFVIEKINNILLVRNAPSPAATSCLAIAKEITSNINFPQLFQV